MKVPQSDEKIWWKCSHANFARVWDPLTRLLSKGVLERCFLESGPTKFFTFCNFRNKVGLAIIFFFKMFKIWYRFQKWIKKKWEKIVGFKDNYISIGEKKFTQSRTGYLSLAVNVLRNTLRFHISLREIFSKSRSPRVMKKYDESALMKILRVSGTL